MRVQTVMPWYRSGPRSTYRTSCTSGRSLLWYSFVGTSVSSLRACRVDGYHSLAVLMAFCPPSCLDTASPSTCLVCRAPFLVICDVSDGVHVVRLDRDDVADVLARCLGTPSATGKTFEVLSLPGLNRVCFLICTSLDTHVSSRLRA